MKLLGELLDFADDTVVLYPVARRRPGPRGGFAKTCLCQIGIVGVELYIMPVCRCKAAFLTLIAQGVGPGGLLRDAGFCPTVGFVARQQLGHLLPRWTLLSLQQPFSNERDDHVSLSAPRPALLGYEQQHDRHKAKASETSMRPVHRDLHGSECVRRGQEPMLPLPSSRCPQIVPRVLREVS